MGFFTPRNRTRLRTLKWPWKAVIVSIMGLFLLFLLMQSTYVQKLMYPIKYESEVTTSARAFAVDPVLIMAVIRVESNFNPEASSPKGAYGLMQLMPETAEWMVDEGHFDEQFLDRLQEPAVNIHMGSWYMGQLLKQFEGHSAAAIAAYNAGPGRVEEWIAEERWDGTLHNLESIPYGETRHYIQRVLYYYDKYKEVHPEILSDKAVVSISRE